MDALENFLSSSNAGLFLDFDGTLSEIVDDPAGARPVDGVASLLTRLSDRLGLVAVVSGRDAHQLVEWLGSDVEIWGVHGAQRASGGRVELSENAAGFADAVRAARDHAVEMLDAQDLPGVLIEDKEIVFNLHYRQSPDPNRARAALATLAEAIAAEHSLEVHEGKMAFELRPPIGFSKADVVLDRSLALELDAAAFVGDDTVDLPAFDALDRLAERGIGTLRVAVEEPESPRALIERADLVVEGIPGVLDLLRRLLD